MEGPSHRAIATPITSQIEAGGKGDKSPKGNIRGNPNGEGNPTGATQGQGKAEFRPKSGTWGGTTTTFVVKLRIQSLGSGG